MSRRLALFVVLIGLTAQTPRSVIAQPAGELRFPRLVLWAWERPEDFRQLPPDTAVAFLAQTIDVNGEGIHVVPRRQPLRVSPATPLLAVTRIQAAPGAIADLEVFDSSDVVEAIARTTRLPQVGGVQIDFDARESERVAYRALLRAVRQRIGSTPLSITALASWCVDSWLDGLPVDEAVPMLFRMGPLNEPFRRAAVAAHATAVRCRGSLGASIDEPGSLRYSARRVYVFNPRSWTDGAIADVRARYQP